MMKMIILVVEVLVVVDLAEEAAREDEILVIGVIALEVLIINLDKDGTACL